MEVSVIIPAYHANATLDECIRGVLAQSFPNSFEVIVCASADRESELPHISEDPRVRAINSPTRLSPAEARNQGAANALGGILVFTDADTRADPDWLLRLVSAAQDGHIVAGAVANGTPENAAGTVEYLVEFCDLHPRRPPASAWHGATCNLAIPRPLWTRYGPFPVAFGGCEDTWLTAHAAKDGMLRFDGTAIISHLNRTSWKMVLANQHRIGRWTAHIAPVTPYRFGILVRSAIWAPAAAAGRVVSLYARMWSWDRRNLLRYVALLPGVLAAETAWAWGLMAEHLLLRRRGP